MVTLKNIKHDRDAATLICDAHNEAKKIQNKLDGLTDDGDDRIKDMISSVKVATGDYMTALMKALNRLK